MQLLKCKFNVLHISSIFNGYCIHVYLIIFSSVQDNIIVLENGHLFNIELVEKSGFKEPVLVQSSEGLDIVVPPSNFTVYDVEQHVGMFI